MLHLERTAQVWAITGNLGGGKTLSSVALAVDSMSRGYFVVTNITLKTDVIASVYGKRVASLYLHISLDSPDFDPFALPCGSPRGTKGGKRVLVILDECAEWVDQYSNAKDPRIARLWSWLRHSSKRSQDVLLIVQRMDYLNKVLRLLISRWIVVDDLAVWRMPVVRLRLPFAGNYVMIRIFDRSGRLLYSPTYCCKSTWGAYYDTAECLNQDGAKVYAEYVAEVRNWEFPAKSFFLWLASLVCVFWYLNYNRRPRADAPRAAVRGQPLGISRISAHFGLNQPHVKGLSGQSLGRTSSHLSAPKAPFDLGLSP